MTAMHGRESRESVFTGTMFGYLGITLATALLSTVTLGIGVPWLVCGYQAWLAEHTYINGKQLRFDGKGGQLFGNYIIWVLLTIVTIGIYGLWVPIKMQQWIVKHTHFADEYGYTDYVDSPRPSSSPSVKTPPIRSVPPITAGTGSMGYCTNCGAALSGGNAVVDGKFCRYCRPEPRDTVHTAIPHTDRRPPATGTHPYAGSGYGKSSSLVMPDDSDLE